MITMNDIARLSGYSRVTVSAALRNKPGVSEKARARILEVAQEHHYVQDQIAVSLRGKPSKLIGVVVRDIGNPYFTHMVEGIENAVAPDGFTLLTISTHEDLQREIQAVRTLAAYRVDGLILCSLTRSADQRHLEIFGRMERPMITVERIQDHQFDCIDFQNVQGGYIATTHLIEKGHQDICYFAGPSNLKASADRFAGFLQALSEHGIQCQDWMRVECGSSSLDGFHSGFDVLRRQEKRPTAIFCFSDLVAIGVYKAAQQLRLHIPQDVSIVGFDDIDLASVLGPALTTVGYGIRNVGRLVGEQMLQTIGSGRRTSGWSQIIKPRLFERDSVQKI
ncbi:LacI family DNA-binding transcriptional regulator [Candidatus Sumerlaeota bacterium]|nr:LacI family DNA-binding transcriptional regulator [Candidatus Sumerlaeota bacterium]